MTEKILFPERGNDLDKFTVINRKITIILLIISFAGFIFTCTVYAMLHKMILKSTDIAAFTDKISEYAGISIIFIFLFHISSIIAIILELKRYSSDSLLRSFIFFLSIISTIMLFGDIALLSDITKEYAAGLLEGIYLEFLILYASQLLHLVFYIFVIILLAITAKKSNFVKKYPDALKDEAIFIDVQYIGIFTSVCGIAILTALSLFTPLWAIKKGIIILCIMLVLPYAAVVVYWLMFKMKERITEWYDEKQFQDVTKAAFLSFLSSIVILAAIFVVQNLYGGFVIINVVWFPYYFFLVLLLFSSVVLYLNKRPGE
jgi:hypothetical protein